MATWPATTKPPRTRPEVIENSFRSHRTLIKLRCGSHQEVITKLPRILALLSSRQPPLPDALLSNNVSGVETECYPQELESGLATKGLKLYLLWGSQKLPAALSKAHISEATNQRINSLSCPPLLSFAWPRTTAKCDWKVIKNALGIHWRIIPQTRFTVLLIIERLMSPLKYIRYVQWPRWSFVGRRGL